MQYMTEKSHREILGQHHEFKECTNSKICVIAGYNKCCNKDCNSHSWNRACVLDNHHASDLIKPCSVVLRKLNLLDHNEQAFPNCCINLPAMSCNKGSVAMKKNEKLEYYNSVAEIGMDNLYIDDEEPYLEDMNSFFESLCESFNSIEDTKKTHCNVLSACSSGEEIVVTSWGLTRNIHPERNEITKASETSKESLLNSSLNCKTPHFSKFKSLKKYPGKQTLKNFNENTGHSFGNDGHKGSDSEIENEVPSHRDIKNLQIGYQSSSETYSQLKSKIYDAPKTDHGLFGDRKNNYNVPPVGTAVKIFPKLPPKDNSLQTDVLLFSSNNSNANCALNCITKDKEIATNICNKNIPEEIEVLERNVLQKNLERARENYSTDKNVALINENAAYLSNHKMKNMVETDSSNVENSDMESQNLQNYVVQRNSKGSTKKHSIDENEKLLVENLSITNSDRLLDTNTHGNDQILHEVTKPCSVFLSIMNKEEIYSFCNTDTTAVREEVENEISLMKKIIQYESGSLFTNLSISPQRIPTVLNRNNVPEFTVNKKQVFNFCKNPLIKPCFVFVYKLPIGDSSKYEHSELMKSSHSKNVFPLRVKIDHGCLKGKKCTICYFSPSADCAISSFKSDKTSNIDDMKFTVINKQTKKVPRQPPLITPCSVSIQRLSDKELMKLGVSFRKASKDSQNNNSKFKRKFTFRTNKRRKLWFWHKQDVLKNRCILNKIHVEKLFYKYKCNEWIKKPKEPPEECEKCQQLKGELNANKCKNVEDSPKQLRENQYLYNTSTDFLPQSSIKRLKTINCSVILEKVNTDEGLHKSENHINQDDLGRYISSVPKCFMSKFKTDECYVSLEKINIDRYLPKNKIVEFRKIRNSLEKRDISSSKCATKNKCIGNKNEENFITNSDSNKLKRSSLRHKESDAKKIKTKVDAWEKNKTVLHNNLICDSDYKCVQCRKSITNDLELYYHLCCGKRKEGYICDICEKIFETVPGLKTHINYHFSFLKLPKMTS